MVPFYVEVEWGHELLTCGRLASDSRVTCGFGSGTLSLKPGKILSIFPIEQLSAHTRTVRMLVLHTVTNEHHTAYSGSSGLLLGLTAW